MGSIEQFIKRLRRTREVMGERLSSIKGQEKVTKALEKIEETEETLSWMPKPGTPGNGVIGEGTKKMSGGRLP